MSEFVPAKIKQQIFGPVGINYYRAKLLHETAEKRAVANVADGMLSEAIRCILVDLDNEARELLRKAKEWLEYAIGANEKPPRDYYHGGTEAIRHENLALCNWLLSDLHDQEDLYSAVRNHEIFDAESRLLKASAAIVLPVYIDSARYELALGLFQRYWPGKHPTNPKHVRGEAAMSYVIAATKLRHEYSDNDVKAGLDNFLGHQVPKFLDHGGYTYLARWLKIAFWNDNSQRLSAFETVRKCYDYLPNVVRP
jgi:hypothetical protein